MARVAAWRRATVGCAAWAGGRPPILRYYPLPSNIHQLLGDSWRRLILMGCVGAQVYDSALTRWNRHTHTEEHVHEARGGEEEATGVNIDHLINSSSTINFSVFICGERAPARTFAGFRTVSVHTSTQMTHSSSSSRSPFPSLSSGYPSLSVSVD